MDRPTFACRRCAAALVVGGILALSWPVPGFAQYGATSGGRRTSSGKAFPTWEQSEDRTPGRVLPTAATGHHDIEEARSFGEPLAGVAGLPMGGFAVALASGRALFVGADLASLGDVPAGFAIGFPPLSSGHGVVVAGGATVALLGPSGVTWQRAFGASLGRAPVLAGPGLVALVEAPGTLTIVAADTGVTMLQATLPGTLTAGPVALPSVLVLGTADGHLVGLDRTDGRLLWDVAVLDRVDGLVADIDAVHAVGEGPNRRHRRVSAPSAIRLALGRDGRTAAGEPSWRLRLGSDSGAVPLLLGKHVVFASGDGFLHAVDRVRGTEDWRTDLPARARSAPVLAGGRLDFVLAPTGYVVAIAADNGAVMGGTALSDEDEAFVGPSAQVAGGTVAATSLGRVVLLRWLFDEPAGERKVAVPVTGATPEPAG